MQRNPAAWNKSFFDYGIRAGIGRALKAHYDHQLAEDHQLGDKLLAQRLAVLLKKIDEFEERKSAPRDKRAK
jgi:hypothetical protein